MLSGPHLSRPRNPLIADTFHRTGAVDWQPSVELMRSSGRSHRTKFLNQVVRPLLDAGLLAMTVPDEPRSSKQKYRTTDSGKSVLAQSERVEPAALTRSWSRGH